MSKVFKIQFVGFVNFDISQILLMIASVVLFYLEIRLLRSTAEQEDVLKMFVTINIFTLIIITLLSLDNLIKLSL